MQLKQIFDHVLDAGTYTELNDASARRYFNEHFDGWKGGCSAIATVLPDGTPLVGRNMDLYISNKPAYVYRTKVSGCYQTVGLSYIHSSGQDYREVLENGLQDEAYQLIPYLTTDVLNEKGLYIETNMRCSEFFPTGQYKFRCSGTNPKAKDRVSSILLPRYLGDHCQNIGEALEYVKDLDIHTSNTNSLTWNFCFLLADAEGRYGLMEIADNKVSWLEGQRAQTNFYVTEELAVQQELKCGVGRYELLMNSIDTVRGEKDLYALMDRVKYSRCYFPERCDFDVKSEFVAARPNWTYDFVTKLENRREVMAHIRKTGEKLALMTRQQRQDNGTYWESTFTEVANCREKTLFVRFFEDEERTLTLRFDTEKGE